MSKLLPDRTRTWTLRIVALLLFLQAVGLVGLNLYQLQAVLGDKPAAEIEGIFTTLAETEDSSQLPETLETMAVVFLTALFLMPLAIPALLAAVGFLFLLRFGWLLAMITQIAGLAICLMLYLEFKPPIVYPIMLYCILMVLYLNIHEVRLVFLARQPREQS